MMRITATCPIGTCDPLWTIDLIAPNANTDLDAQQQAARCISDHIQVAHMDSIPVVNV